MIKAALFDLDGVVFDTESQYSVFWGMIGKEYHPEMPDFAHRIKGQTLVQIYDKYFSDDATFAHIDGYTDCKSEQAKITARLDEFELNMSYPYIPGFETFLKDVKAHGVKCAVVTSSNLQKMEQVYKHHPEFKTYLTACSPAKILPRASRIQTVISRVLPVSEQSRRNAWGWKTASTD